MNFLDRFPLRIVFVIVLAIVPLYSCFDSDGAELGTPPTSAALIKIAGDGKLLEGGLVPGDDRVRDVPWVKEIGRISTHDGIFVDNADVRNVTVSDVAGYAVRVTRTTPPAFDRIDQPTIEGLRAIQCLGGIFVDQWCPDALILDPRIANCRDPLLNLQGGNCHEHGGHCYGGGTIVQMGGALWSGWVHVNELQASDGALCFVVLAHGSRINDSFSQHARERGILVGAQCDIDSTNVRGLEPGATAVEFARGPRTIDGVERFLNSNWGSLSNCSIEIGPTNDGIVINADHVTVDSSLVTGKGRALVVGTPAPVSAAKAKADPPTTGSRITVKICEGSVVIGELGPNNRIDVSGSPSSVVLPAKWDATTNEIKINNRIAKPGDYLAKPKGNR